MAVVVVMVLVAIRHQSSEEALFSLAEDRAKEQKQLSLKFEDRRCRFNEMAEKNHARLLLLSSHALLRLKFMARE